MRRIFTQRMTTAAGWVTVAITLTVCFLGLKLTAARSRDMGGVLLEIQTDAAQAVRPKLEALLDEEERTILAELAAAEEDAAAVRAVVERHPIIGEPLLFATDGSFVAPLRGKAPPRSPLVADDPAPPEFERALRLAWSEAPLSEKARALEAVCRAEALAPAWRLRAASTLAALEARSGDAARAAERYDNLFVEHDGILHDAARPSYLQLIIARSNALLRAGNPERARQCAMRALEEVRAGSLNAPLEEEQFFIARTREILASAGGEPPPVLLEVEGRHARERLALAVVETLRDWIFARSRLEMVISEVGKPQYFFEPSSAAGGAAEAGAEGSGGRPAPPRGLKEPIFAVWTRLLPSPSGPGLAAVGFRADLQMLERFLSERLHSISPEGRLSVDALAADRGAALVPLASFTEARDFIRLGLPRDVWDDLVGKAREPFDFVAFLLVVLAVASVLGILAFFRGVRREIALSRMKTEFVANVSHELKTPLSLIRLFGETLLLDRVADPEQRKKYYQIITRESERLTHLISNVLSFATIEAGRKSYELKPCDVARVARETYEIYRFQLDEKGFVHRFDAATGLPSASADAFAVAQAVINLVENAIKYSSDQKEIEVRVTGSNGSVRVSIADRGIGIARDDQPRIWEDFYRTREARALGTRGSGLGLSVVQHIMKAHGGRVELESSPGQGSVFTLVFPGAPPDEVTAEVDSLPRGA
jgi:signal transduction histidine kinase